MLLEAIPQHEIDTIVYRLANVRGHGEAFAALGSDQHEVESTLDFLGRGPTEDAAVLLDAPFRVDPSRSPPSLRFSDSRQRAFYAAAEVETCEAECLHHYARNALFGADRVYYQCLRARASGAGYDLRPHVGRFPFLRDDAYSDCQELAREAIAHGAALLQSVSARRFDGTTVPVFVRAALSEPSIIGAVTFRKNLHGEVEVERSFV